MLGILSGPAPGGRSRCPLVRSYASMRECPARTEAFLRDGVGEMRKRSSMGRVRMLGLALVVVLAAVGFLAAGASAAPEWMGCVKTEPKHTGKYTDKLCTLESPTGEGNFEIAPSIGK